MNSYYESYFQGNELLIHREQTENLVNIKEIKEYVDRTADNDSEISTLKAIESDYPPGYQAYSQVVKIERYGFFVEFGLRGRGIVHWKNFNGHENILDEIEIGDWVTVEIISYDLHHKKFELKLIDYE